MLMTIKPIAPFGVEFQDEAFFLRGHLASFEARVEVINPTETATLTCSVETYKVQKKLMRG